MTALSGRNLLKVISVRSVTKYVPPAVSFLCPLGFTLTTLQPGHLVRDCPTRNAVGDTGGRKPREGYVCRACGGDGHYLDDCPITNQRAPPGDRKGGRRGPPREIGREYILLKVLTFPTQLPLCS